ncbi:MAG: hypothetical protein ABIY47_17915, partial [Opitutaceae bacterium]
QPCGTTCSGNAKVSSPSRPIRVTARKKLLVVDIAALGWNLVSHLPEFRPAEAVFPAETCTAQA